MKRKLSKEEIKRRLEESAQIFKVYGSPLKPNPIFEKHRKESKK